MTVNASTVLPIPNQLVLKNQKESVVKSVKLLNVLKMKLSLRMDHVKHAHHGQCHNRMQEYVDQVSVELVKGS